MPQRKATSTPLPVAITTGEPAGIGPELTLMLAERGELPPYSVAVGDVTLLAERAALLGLTVELAVCHPGEPLPEGPGVLPVWPVVLDAPSK
ncbi:MAG: 4-hydroxythreonine-4-phosphate dehydrogenase PdxA, partial [Pseudomonadota bacterium]